ncbi:MAG: HD domain-containing phosphohydrolase [Pygmaiobacter massiliensis]
MSLNEKLFIIVPLVSVLCNAFLFLTCLSAKKDRVIYAFLELLAVFMAWCGGSLFMRLELYPGSLFWYELSIMGIFLVPVFVYNFIYRFCDAKGSFIRTLLFASWIVITAMNLSHVFIHDPRVFEVDGERMFAFSVSSAIVFPLVLAIFTLGMAWHTAVRGVKEGRVSMVDLRPLIIGVLVMFVGTFLDVFPIFVSLPNDTLVCGINALFLYYALYRRRLITLTHIASNSSSYLLSAIFTTLILIASFSGVDQFYNQYLGAFAEYKTIVVAVGFSLLTMAVYHVTRRMMNNLFTKRQEARDTTLKQFSVSVSKELELEPLLDLYKNFLQENFPTRTAYLCVHEAQMHRYRIVSCTQEMTELSFELSDSHPLIKWLIEQKHSVYYNDFARTQSFKSMWQAEKRLLADLNVGYVLPLIYDDELAGITFFTHTEGKNRFSPGELNYLDSAGAILSIALRNAYMYTAMQQEAREDAMTGLYNRGYFNECIKKEFALARHDTATLMMLNMDDFRLYNELYGIREGDAALVQLSHNLKAIIGNRGVIARYSGKEFAVFLPFCDARVAQELALHLKKLPVTPPDSNRYLTYSIGICTYPVCAANIDELFTYASMAVYSGKTDGKNRVVIYSPHTASASDSTCTSKKALAESCASTIYALTAAIDAKDHYTFNHSQNVSEYASKLAQAIPLDTEHVEIIRQAGLLHDIGKIGIPESILSKTSTLSNEEYQIMKTHAEGAMAMIRHLPSLDYVIPTAIAHHERWDGKGYPRGLAGEVIPIGGRCLCLADSFDAMTSKRSYKDALTVEAALDEIRRNLGTQFDPQLGLLFIRLVEDGTITVYGNAGV